MNAMRLQDAIGEIQDCYILAAHSEQNKAHTNSKKWIAVFIAAAIMALAFAACAPILFNSLSGDDLSLNASYQGNGIVEITVENKSDKTLRFQESMKLKHWSTDQEVLAKGKARFSGTKIPAHGRGIMTIDLSNAYNIAELEMPLSSDSYYFVLTNNNFLFGQDWVCSVDFFEKQCEEPVYSSPISSSKASPDLAKEVEPDLQRFFDTSIDPQTRRELYGEYYKACAKLIQNSGKSFIRPISPAPSLLYDVPPKETIFDSNLPEDVQYQLIGLQESSVDDFFFPVGAAGEDTAIVFSVVIPQSQADCYRVQGDAIRIGYVMVYDAQQCQTADTYTLIHGQLVPINDLAQYIVYEDSQYIVCNVTNYFFTDIDAHIAAFQSWRADLFFNDDVYSRIKNAYRYVQRIQMYLYTQ